jgi:hypothetical protein
MSYIYRERKYFFLSIVDIVFSAWLQIRALSVFGAAADANVFILLQAMPTLAAQLVSPGIVAFNLRFLSSLSSAAAESRIVKASIKWALIGLLFSALASPLYFWINTNNVYIFDARAYVYLATFCVSGFLSVWCVGLSLVLRLRGSHDALTKINLTGTASALIALEFLNRNWDLDLYVSIIAIFIKSIAIAFLISLKIGKSIFNIRIKFVEKGGDDIIRYGLLTAVGKLQPPVDKLLISGSAPEFLPGYAIVSAACAQATLVYDKTVNFWLASEATAFHARFRFLLKLWGVAAVILLITATLLKGGISAIAAKIMAPYELGFLSDFISELLFLALALTMGATLSSSISTSMNLQQKALVSAQIHFWTNLLTIVPKIVFYNQVFHIKYIIILVFISYFSYCIISLYFLWCDRGPID